jgi:hypothetical protein
LSPARLELATLYSFVPVTPDVVEVRLQDVADERRLVLCILLPLLRCVLAGQQPPGRHIPQSRAAAACSY